MFVVMYDQKTCKVTTDHIPTLLDSLAGVPTVAPFQRVGTSEVQGVLDDPIAVRHAVLAGLRPGVWNIGIGAGPVEDGSYHAGIAGGRGVAFVAARTAVENAKGRLTGIAVRAGINGSPGSAWAADCEAVWTFVAGVVQDRTEAQWRAVDAVDQAETKASAAKTLGISPATIGGNLRLSQISEERAAYGALDRLLAGADAASAE